MNSLPLLVTSEPRLTIVRAMCRELDLSATDEELAVGLFDRNLPPLATADCLPFLFGVSRKLIWAMAERNNRYYRRFVIRKKSGSQREIASPKRFLKLIQRWIAAHILTHVDTPIYVTGFVANRGIFENARHHLKNRNLLCVDIEDFFPSIKRGQVEHIFNERFGFPAKVSKQLAGLCTLDGVLPQGAPTSPALSNIVFEPVDRELKRRGEVWGCTYTRYADDLAFSGTKHFTPDDVRVLATIIGEYGFRLNNSKTRIIGSGGRKLVTGLITNERLQVPRSTRRLWRAMFHRASKHPREFYDRINELQGIVAFLNQYDSELSQQYRQIIASVETKGYLKPR